VAARKQETPRCEDCYFRKKMLCALDLEEPCSTFRADRPEGLVPPRQPRLLLRPPRWAAEQRAGQIAGNGGDGNGAARSGAARNGAARNGADGNGAAARMAGAGAGGEPAGQMAGAGAAGQG
jgi:hypothetical protein